MKCMICLPWNSFFFWNLRVLVRNLPVRLATQRKYLRKYLRKFNLPLLATTCESVRSGHNWIPSRSSTSSKERLPKEITCTEYSGVQSFRISKGNEIWFEYRGQNYSDRLKRARKRLLLRVIGRFKKWVFTRSVFLWICILTIHSNLKSMSLNSGLSLNTDLLSQYCNSMNIHNTIQNCNISAR